MTTNGPIPLPEPHAMGRLLSAAVAAAGDPPEVLAASILKRVVDDATGRVHEALRRLSSTNPDFRAALAVLGDAGGDDAQFASEDEPDPAWLQSVVLLAPQANKQEEVDWEAKWARSRRRLLKIRDQETRWKKMVAAVLEEAGAGELRQLGAAMQELHRLLETVKQQGEKSDSCQGQLAHSITSLSGVTEKAAAVQQNMSELLVQLSERAWGAVPAPTAMPPISVSQLPEQPPQHKVELPVASYPGRSGFSGKLQFLASLAAVAASILAIGVFIMQGQAQARAQSQAIAQLKAALTDSQSTIADLVQQISKSGAGRAVPVAASSSFQDEFERLRRFQPRSLPNQAKLGLVLNPFIGPPHYVAVRATWDDDHSHWLYRAGVVPLEPEAILDFADLTPKSGERRVTLVLEFHTTEEAMRNIDEIGPVIRKRIPLIVSQAGVRVASAEDQAAVKASIALPHQDQIVDDQFVMGLSLQRPAMVAGGRADLNRMVHILARAVDGSATWQNQYYVVPFRKRVDQLAEGGEKFTLAVSLKGILETIPPDERPTQFQLLVVDVPFQLDGWTVGRNVVDFSQPFAERMICDQTTVQLRPITEE